MNWLHANTIGNDDCARTAGQVAYKSLFSFFFFLCLLRVFCWASQIRRITGSMTAPGTGKGLEQRGRTGRDLAEQLEEKDCKGNRWVLAIPRLLLLELLVEVLLTTDPGLAITTVLALPYDANLLFRVALVPARGEVGRSRVGRVVTTFPPRPMVGELDLHLLVGGLDRLLLLDVTVRRREDAEGDGDSCFKIQLDCPVCTELSSPLALFSDDDRLLSRSAKRKRRKDSSGFFRGKEVEREERKEKDPTN